MTLKEKIRAANDLRKEAVYVPEWDVTVYVRTMLASERDSWEAETYQLQANDEGKQEVNINKQNIRGRLLVRVLVDESGARIFNDDDAAELGNKSTTVVSRLYEIAQRVNAVTSEDVDKLAKNS